jgi:pimeloyl-ACP methyl ester carboxylesterase
LSTDADDADLLIKHLSPDPAIVFGSSSGAVVAQRLLERHPGSVKKLVAHEPPSLAVLPDEFRVQGAALFQHVYDTYRAHGPEEAISVFASGFGEGGDGPVMRFCMDSKRGDEIRANVMFWFEFELRQYTSEAVNMELLAAEKNKYVPMAGVESGNGPGVAPISVIAQILEKELVRVPGGHIGYTTSSEAFAGALSRVLK